MDKNIIIFIVFAFSFLSCKPKYDEVSPRMAPVTEAVFASGSIDPKDAYTLTCLSDGFIVKSFVSENDVVRDKQVLFQLDNRQQYIQVNIARNNMEYAKKNSDYNSPTLLQIKNQLNAAVAKMNNDSITLTRFEHLYSTNSVSKQDFDNALLNFTSSKSNYYALLENYKIASDRVRQDYDNSKEQLHNAEEGNQYYNLQAIGTGKVYQIFKKQGDLVRRGEKVAQLGNPDSIVINLDIDEGTISKIKIGQEALIELNTEKNKTYAATITKIYPHFNESSQSYKVEARFNQVNQWLIAGTQLQANIITAKKDNVLLIPHIYIIGDNKVAVKKDKKIDTVKITTGISSDEWIEVTSGLTINDVVVKIK